MKVLSKVYRLHEPMSCVFMPPQILLVSDYFYAYLRREHHLTHGLYLKKEDGTEATLVLKWPSFIHGTKRSHRLPHTPTSLLVFYLTFHSHYSFFPQVFYFHLNFPLLSFFKTCYFLLHIWEFYLMFGCWHPLLDQSCFVRDFFDNGTDWRYLNDTGTLLFDLFGSLEWCNEKRGG